MIYLDLLMENRDKEDKHDANVEKIVMVEFGSIGCNMLHCSYLRKPNRKHLLISQLNKDSGVEVAHKSSDTYL